MKELETVRKKRRSPLRRIYHFIVVLSAMIVILYLGIPLLIRPPEIAAAGQQSDSSGDTLGEGESPLQTASSKERKTNCYTFLLAASDDGNGNADTIMVMTYDVEAGTVGIVSVPRDTMVRTSRNTPKINAAYSEGIEELKDEVSNLVGFPIDFYVTVDINAFIDLVNQVGGIDFNVPIDMDYDDWVQDLYIHFEKGWQHLDGEQAMEVARFRKNNDGTGYPNSDVDRAATQRDMLKTIAKKVMAWENLGKIKSFLDIFKSNVDTNLTAGNITYFASKALTLNLDTDLQSGTLPGDGTITYRGVEWCYQLYADESLEMLNQLVNPYTEDLTAEDVSFLEVQ